MEELILAGPKHCFDLINSQIELNGWHNLSFNCGLIPNYQPGSGFFFRLEPLAGILFDGPFVGRIMEIHRSKILVGLTINLAKKIPLYVAGKTHSTFLSRAFKGAV
jgi:hypothetical protein